MVQQDHLVHKVARSIDFEFIHDEGAHLCCQDNGHLAVGPIWLFKIILLGYLFGIKSERQWISQCGLPLVLGVYLTKKVIDTSTLSQNNLRRFNGADVFEHIFYLYRMENNWKRLDGGKYPFTDSTHLKPALIRTKNIIKSIRYESVSILICSIKMWWKYEKRKEAVKSEWKSDRNQRYQGKHRIILGADVD